uniref:Uncharacterized protein n=1 Tax=Equus caballus TaxID=9796 RepID=A0A9L0TK15_HORSE
MALREDLGLWFSRRLLRATGSEGVMVRMQPNSAQTPVEWIAGGYRKCDAGENCQETLLLVDVGHRSLIVGSKGCSKIRTHESPTVTVHSGPPGMLVASSARFCSSSGCNRVDSSSVLLDAILHPGDLQCPAYVSCLDPAHKTLKLLPALRAPFVVTVVPLISGEVGCPLHWTFRAAWPTFPDICGTTHPILGSLP